MMYAHLPDGHRSAIKVMLSSTWLLVAAGGASAIFFTPVTIASELGTYLTYFWGAIVAIAAVVALVGVVRDHYRLEWVAAWFASGGLSVYVGVLWWLVITGSETRLTQAFLISALLAHTMNRAALCAAHAAKLREQSTETGEIGVVP